MSASVNDYFQMLGGASSLINTPKVTATRSAAGTTLTVDNCNWDQTTGKRFATFQVDTSGAVVDGTETIWKGIVTSTTSIGSLARVAGAADSGNAIGDYVMLLPASDWGNQLVTGLLVEHNQDGTHGAVTTTSITNTGNLTSTGTTQLNGTFDGWTGANDTWTYSSYDSTNKTGVITVPSDATTKYSVGMRVKFTNNSSTQYGIITKVAATSLTVYFGTDYSLTNSAISAIYYSVHKAPFGFPLDPAKWTVSLVDNTFNSLVLSSSWQYISPMTLAVPIGVWNLEYSIYLEVTKAATTGISILGTLSTANSTESDTEFTSYLELDGASATLALWSLVARRKAVSLSSATTYYFNIKAGTVGATGAVNPKGSTNVIKAVCAYL